MAGYDARQDRGKRLGQSGMRALLCGAICLPLVLAGCAGGLGDTAGKAARRDPNLPTFVETPLGAPVTAPPAEQAGAESAGPALVAAADPAREAGAPSRVPAGQKTREVYAETPASAAVPPSVPVAGPVLVPAATSPAAASLSNQPDRGERAAGAGEAAAPPALPIPASSLPITSATAPVPITPQHAPAVAPADAAAPVSGAPVLMPPSAQSATHPTQPASASSAAASARAVSPARPGPATEQAAYKAALAAYEGRHYREGERLFDAFMRDYPHSKLLPNALYWKAECLYTRGLYADAIFVFKDVTARYPKHPKAADALLKTGMSYDRMNDADNAKLHYRVLAEDYPSSQATRKARELRLIP